MSKPMDHFLPEIYWHSRQAILSVDFQRYGDGSEKVYKIVTSSVEKDVRIWDFCFEIDERKKEGLAVNFIANLPGHSGTINVARFSPNGQLLASGDSDGGIFIWGIGEGPIVPAVFSGRELPDNKENWIRKRTPFRQDSDVCGLAWSPNSQFLVSASRDESVVNRNIATGKRVWELNKLCSFPNGVCWDPRGKYIVTMSTDRKMHFIDAKSGAKLLCLKHLHVRSHRFAPELSARLGVHRIFHDDQLMTFVRCADFSPDGQLLIVPSGQLRGKDQDYYGTFVFRRLDFDLGRPQGFYPSKRPTFRVAACPISFQLRKEVKENMMKIPYRTVWAAMTKDTVVFYDSQSSKPIMLCSNIHYESLSCMAWSPDGSILLVSSLEGYCSFIKFNVSAIGVVWEELPSPPPSPVMYKKVKSAKKVRKSRHAKMSDTDSPKVKSKATDHQDKAVNEKESVDKKAKPRTSSPPNSILKYFAKMRDKNLKKAKELEESGSGSGVHESVNEPGPSSPVYKPFDDPESSSHLLKSFEKLGPISPVFKSFDGPGRSARKQKTPKAYKLVNKGPLKFSIKPASDNCEPTGNNGKNAYDWNREIPTSSTSKYPKVNRNKAKMGCKVCGCTAAVRSRKMPEEKDARNGKRLKLETTDPGRAE